jgi:cytochrome oxidase Cu insertion factor (SCO1/SenC/PrrC family)
VLGIAYGALTVAQHFRGSRSPAIVHVDKPVPLPSGPPLESFELTDSQGRPFSSAGLRGKVWLGSFFFTACPGSCWKMNQAIAGLQKRFADTDVQFVSITCDPENDTPEALAQYAQLFQADPARWHFLTGKMDYLQRIGTEWFKLTVVPKDHSTRAMLVGRDGQIVGHYQLLDADDLARLERAIPKALAAPAPEAAPSPLPGEGAGVRAASPASASPRADAPSPQPSPGGRGGQTP